MYICIYIHIWRCLVCFVVSRLVNMGPSCGGTCGLYWGGVSSSNLHASRRGCEESLAWLRLGLGKAGGSRMGWRGCQEGRTQYFPFILQKKEFKSTFQERTVGFVGDMAWIETDSRQKCVSSTQQVMHLWINSICNQILLSEWSIELPIGLPVVLSAGLPSDMPT